MTEFNAKQIAQETITQLLTTSIILPEYFSTKQAAKYLGLSRQCLEIWRCKGGGPKYTKLAQAVRYRKADLDSYMADRTQRHTAEG